MMAKPARFGATSTAALETCSAQCDFFFKYSMLAFVKDGALRGLSSVVYPINSHINLPPAPHLSRHLEPASFSSLTAAAARRPPPAPRSPPMGCPTGHPPALVTAQSSLNSRPAAIALAFIGVPATAQGW